MKKYLSLAILVAISAVTHAQTLEQDVSIEAELRLLQQKVAQLESEAKHTHQKVTQLDSQPKNPVTFKPYGFVRFDLAHHIEGADKIFNKISTLPLDSGRNVDGRTLYNVNTSRFGVDIQSTVQNKNVSAKVEIDFRGGSDNDQLRVRHAYIKVDKWLFGQTTSPFVSVDILPEMVDFMANVGGGIQRNPMIQYHHDFNQNIRSWVALEDGSRGIDDQTRLPALTTKTQFKSDNGKNILNFRTLTLQKKTSEDQALAWGVGFGGVYHLDKANKIHADYYHVKGDSKFMLFANDGYVLNQDQQIVENEYDSLALAITHNWNSQWRSTLGVGAMLADDSGQYARLKMDANESLYQGWVNVFYAQNKSLSYALEYVYGQRTTFAEEQGTDNRIEAMLRYSF